MNSAKSFLLEVWNDLRARRLLPVAALLIAALVAAPLVLSKKSETPSAPPTGAATAQGASAQPQGPEALAQVKLDESGAGEGSSLSSFDPDNPFAPPKQVVAAAEEEAGGGAEAPSGDTGSGAAPGAGTGGGETDGGQTGGDETGGGDTGGGDTGGGQTKTVEFTYVIDVTFWSNGRKREVKGMDKLDVLPGQANPLLIFMGVTSGGGNAVFLVDSTLTASGEGACKPSNADCATVEVGPGSQELFTNDLGDSYRLRIDQIRKVKVEDEPQAEAGKAKKSATAAVGSDGPTRRFVPPLLSDLIVVTVGGDDNSTGAQKRR